MKSAYKWILPTALLSGVAFGGSLPFTTPVVSGAIANEVNQFGAAGYSVATNVTVDADTWTDVPASFIIPYSSGFNYVNGSTIVYTNGPKCYLFGGSLSISSGASVTYIEVGIETNGVYVVGSTTGPRYFSSSSDSGSLSYAFPIELTNGDTIGLVIKSDKGQTIVINAWHYWTLRF